MKKPIPIIPIMAFLILGLAAFVLYRRYKKTQLISGEVLAGSSGNTGIGGGLGECAKGGTPNCTKLLKKGVRGIEVCRLQKHLNSNPGSRGMIAVDGIFGPITEATLNEQYQTVETTLLSLNACF